MKSLLTLKQELDQSINDQKNNPLTPANFVIDAYVYADDDQYKNEIKHFSQLPRPISSNNDFLETEDRTFYNSCPHRGARLTQNEDEEAFTCPYHGWEFDRAGKLSKSTGHNCPYPKGSLKLKEVETSKIGGMSFINAQHLLKTNYIQEINSYSKNAVFLENITYKVSCNWKFLVESLLETYHFPFAHKSFLKDFDNAFYSMHSNELFNARTVVPLQNFEDFKKLDNFQGINVMYHLFPYSFVLFMNVGYVWFHIDAIEKNKSKITYSLFSYENGSKEDAKKSLSLLEKILDQDFEILEGQQKNLELNQVKKYHFTHYEKLIHAFHMNIAKTSSTSMSLNSSQFDDRV